MMRAKNAGRTLRLFGFRQTIRGALTISIFAGLMMGIYGTVIVKTYPTQAERDVLVKELEATPAVNFLAGEVKNAATPASYAIYKMLPMVTIVAALWGLTVTTRLLRGQEEDGRLELLESGVTTRRQVATQLLVGFGYSFLVAIGVMWIVIAALGAAPHVNLSVSAALLMTLSVLLPGIVFAGLGIVTSQLSLTRSRAVMYGLIPLLVLYCIRGAGNTTESLNWLKKFSPFGWSDLMNPVLDANPLWILPPLICFGIFMVLGLFWAGRRDYGTSLVLQREEVRSRLNLLSSPLMFGLRQKYSVLIAWLVGTVAFVSFIAALAGMVSDILNNNQTLHAFITVTPDKIKLLFIGSAFMILGLILLALTIVEIMSIRRDESKAYLDNILVQPVSRTRWLAGRLTISSIMAILVALSSTIAIWLVARLGSIDLGFDRAIFSSISVLAGVFFVLGVGVTLYGVLPRLAVIGMTIVVAWAFVIDIIKSLLHLNEWVEKTSVLYYIPADPTKSLEWSGILWLFGIGLVLCIAGVSAFSQRDIKLE